jgi:mannose-6-phosphate isomerase-like protein (cupin superfamily)
MYGEEGDEVKYNIDHDLWSKYHFYLQLARIPVKNELDLGRLLQIAYNLGQLSVHLNDDPIFTSKSKEYFEINQLNNINSYINLDGKILNKLEKDRLNNIEIYVKQIIDKTLLKDFERKPFYGNLKELTIDNKNYRKVLYTGKQQQLILINLKPNDFIKQESYDTIDQFVRVEKGNGIVIIDGIDYELKDGIELIIPAGSQYKIVNTSLTNLSLYTIYSPPEYAKTLVQESNPELKTTYLKKYLKYKKKYLSLKNKF